MRPACAFALALTAGCSFHGDGALADAPNADGRVGDGSAMPPLPDAVFAYTKTIAINANGVGVDLTGFPLLIHEAADPQLVQHARADGADLVFLDETDAPIAHELELIEPDGGILAWVRVPTIYAAHATEIHLAYGSGVAAASTATAVWDATFAAVYHLDETTGAMRDSTRNGHDGTVLATPMRGAPGAIGFGVKAAGMSCIDLGDHFDFPGKQAWTITLWTEAQTSMPAMADYHRLLAREDYPGHAGMDLEQHGSSGVPQVGRTIGPNPNDTSFGYVPIALSSTAFTAIAAVYDGATLAMYGNGAIGVGSADARSMPAVSKRFTLGCDDYTGAAADTYPGTLDEVRIATAARSPAWLAYEHAQEAAPDASYVIGPEQAR